MKIHHVKQDLDYMVPKGIKQIPNINILEKEITNSRDNLCSSNLKM
jgi:hypothetical protein